MITENDIEIYKELVKKEITSTRFEHSLRVADIAKRLSAIHGYPEPLEAYLAGVLHDITKQKNNSFHKEIFLKYNFDFNELPQEAYHPFSAYFYIKEKYDFHEEEILSAVKNHTLGGSDLTLLDRILYVSDFLGSDFAERSEDFQSWIQKTEKDLSFGILLKASNTISDLSKKMLPIHISTYYMYQKAILDLSKNKLNDS